MQPIVFGLNYQTADFELRDRLAFASEELPIVLRRLLNSGITKEVILLSTCNRTELYCITHDINFVINALCDMHNVCPRSIRQHSYIYEGSECAEHLFRVTSGLESMVLGESEIVAQVKTAMEIAKANHCLGSNLAGLFQMALAVEKDVRSYTAINNVAVSMGHAVVKYVAQHFHSLPNRKVLFVGAGQMMQQIAPHFNYLDLEQKVVVNRTLAKAQLLAAKIEAEAASLLNLAEIIDQFAIVVICCASNTPIIDEQMLASAISNKTPKLLVDLSMPLVISKTLLKQPNFSVITVDEIAGLVDVGIEKRKLAAIEAEGIIAAKLEDYQAWLRKRGFTPLIRKLREQSELIRIDSLATAEKQLLNGEAPADVLKQFSVQLTNRLLHNPTVNLCASSGPHQDELAELLSHLYNLEI